MCVLRYISSFTTCCFPRSVQNKYITPAARNVCHVSTLLTPLETAGPRLKGSSLAAVRAGFFFDLSDPTALAVSPPLTLTAGVAAVVQRAIRYPLRLYIAKFTTTNDDTTLLLTTLTPTSPPPRPPTPWSTTISTL